MSGKRETDAIRLLLAGNILRTRSDFGFVNLPTRVDWKWGGGGGYNLDYISYNYLT